MRMLNAVRGCAVPGLAGASMFWTGHSGKPGIDLSLIGTRLGTAWIAALMGAAATLMFSDAADAARRRPHPSAAPALDAQAVNGAQLSAPSGKRRASAASAATIIKAKILLDRAGFSPGQIDGKSGSNDKKAIAAFQDANGIKPSGRLDPQTWEQIGGHRSRLGRRRKADQLLSGLGWQRGAALSQRDADHSLGR
jgi:Putative peptidoglycan binding domain